jgi:hypothetical protein
MTQQKPSWLLNARYYRTKNVSISPNNNCKILKLQHTSGFAGNGVVVLSSNASAGVLRSSIFSNFDPANVFCALALVSKPAVVSLSVLVLIGSVESPFFDVPSLDVFASDALSPLLVVEKSWVTLTS